MTAHPPIRCGVVGIHGFARDHFDHLLPLQDEGQVTVAAAVAHQRELDPAFAAKLEGRGVRLLPDLDALLAEPGLELITLPVGIHLHVPFARRVLAAGRACYLEKPVAGTLAEGMALQRAEAAAGRPLFVGFQDLFHPAIRALKRRLLAGALGRLRRVVVTASWPRGTDYYARNRWAGRMQLDGAPVRDSPANNACAHYLALALFLAGRGEDESAWPLAAGGGLWRAHAIESFDTASLRIATDAGPEVVFTAAHATSEDWGPQIRIEGDDGAAESDYRFHNSEWRLPRGEVVAVEGRVGARFRHVVEVLRGGRAPVCTLAHALPHSAAVDLAHAALPVRPVPAERIRRAGTAVVCDGLDALLHEAHRRGTTLDTLGFAV